MKGDMNWHDVKTSIRETPRSRNLATPRLKLNALESLDRLFDVHCPEVKLQPESISAYILRWGLTCSLLHMITSWAGKT